MAALGYPQRESPEVVERCLSNDYEIVERIYTARMGLSKLDWGESLQLFKPIGLQGMRGIDHDLLG